MGDSADGWETVRLRDQRGSRARCILLTHGPKEKVAERLTALISPFGKVDPNRHIWKPRGIAGPDETKLLEDGSSFLSDAAREDIASWWLAVRQNANTPNWDVASTATIGALEGLVLVEAKAHAAELKTTGKPATGREENHIRIHSACKEANYALNSVGAGWALSADSHYQLCNRFAWAWKIASLGVPVILIYLGFLNAREMRDQGPPFDSFEEWERLVRDHSRGIVPDIMWDEPLLINGTPLHAKIKSLEIPLETA